MVALRHGQAQLREFANAPEMNVYGVLPKLAVHGESGNVVIWGRREAVRWLWNGTDDVGNLVGFCITDIVEALSITNNYTV